MSHMPAESAFLIHDSSDGLVGRAMPPSSVMISVKTFSSYCICSSEVYPIRRTRTIKKFFIDSSVSLPHISQNSSLHSAFAMARQKSGTFVTAPAISALAISNIAFTCAALLGI